MIRVPIACEPYIRVQRSAYGEQLANVAYAEDMKAEVDMIEPYLPKRIAAALDIGCGCGGISAELLRRNLVGKAVLVDRSTASIRRAGFDETECFQNDLDLTRILLAANRVMSYRAIIVDLAKASIPKTTFRLIFSLYSWGYHYPIEAYLPLVREQLAKTGVVILDVRDGTDGIETLERTFDDVKIIATGNKRARVVCQKVKHG